MLWCNKDINWIISYWSVILTTVGFFVGLFIVLHSVRNSYEHARNVVLRGIKSISGLLLVTSMIIILGPLSLSIIITLGPPIKIGGV